MQNMGDSSVLTIKPTDKLKYENNTIYEVHFTTVTVTTSNALMTK